MNKSSKNVKIYKSKSTSQQTREYLKALLFCYNDIDQQMQQRHKRKDTIETAVNKSIIVMQYEPVDFQLKP